MSHFYCYGGYSLPFSNSDSSHEVSGVPALLACEEGFLVGELINLGFEIYVGGVDIDICIIFSSGEPATCVVSRQVTRWLHNLLTIDDWKRNKQNIPLTELPCFLCLFFIVGLYLYTHLILLKSISCLHIM